MAKFTTALFINSVFKTFEQFIFNKSAQVVNQVGILNMTLYQHVWLSGERVRLKNSNISFDFSGGSNPIDQIHFLSLSSFIFCFYNILYF